MTYRQWMNARRLLFEEKYGVLIRAEQRKTRVREEEMSEHYRRSVQLLKMQE